MMTFSHKTHSWLATKDCKAVEELQL